MLKYLYNACLSSMLCTAFVLLPQSSPALESATSPGGNQFIFSDNMMNGLTAPITNTKNLMDAETAARAAADVTLGQNLTTLESYVTTLSNQAAILALEYNALKACIDNGTCVTVNNGGIRTHDTSFTVNSKGNTFLTSVGYKILDTNLNISQWPFCAVVGRRNAEAKDFYVEPGTDSRAGRWVVRMEDTDFLGDWADGTVSGNCFRFE